MRVRVFTILLVLAVTALWPPGSCRAAGKVIAAMTSSDQPRYREAHRAFVKSMASRGYAMPDIEIILQTPNADQLSWSNTIRKFNAYRPSMIVAYGAPAIQAAMKESEGIPVVAVDMYAPEQPVKGTRGVSSRVPMITLLKTIQDIHPTRRVGVIYTSREIGSQRQMDDIRKSASKLGMTVIDGNVVSNASLDPVLAAMLEKVDAILVTESSVACRQFERIVARAKTRNIPVMSTMPDAAEKGALVSLEINPQEQGHLAAEIAVRILEGARAEHLSLLSPRRIDLIINMRTARTMGMTVPFTVLGSATRLLK